MIIHLIKESSIDFPGKFGPIVFTKGCNFDCGFCHNASLNKLTEFIDEGKIISELNLKNKWYNGITISGGEPTLHGERLIDFIRKLKEIKIAVKIDTNLSNPQIIKKLIDERLIDYFAADIKGPKELYPEITNREADLDKIEESIKILVYSGINFELRTTIPLIKDSGILRFLNEKETEEMGKWIYSLVRPNEKKIKWVLQKFISYPSEEINDKDFALENIAEDLKETPDEHAEKLKKVLEKFNFDVSVR